MQDTSIQKSWERINPRKFPGAKHLFFFSLFFDGTGCIFVADVGSPQALKSNGELEVIEAVM